MSQQRAERVAGELRAIIGEVLARQEIKDPRVRGAGLITVTHIRLSGDLRQAHVLFTVHNAGEAELERVREGLDHAAGYFRQVIGRRLRLKVLPTVRFEIDRVFEQATRVENLLREIAPHPEAKAKSDDDGDADGDAGTEAEGEAGSEPDGEDGEK